MLGELRKRVERAVGAFMAAPPAGPISSGSRAIVEMALPPLRGDEVEAVQEQALALLDGNVRGWLIVTVRDVGTGADIEAQWRMPACAWPVVGACLVEPLMMGGAS